MHRKTCLNARETLRDSRKLASLRGQWTPTTVLLVPTCPEGTDGIAQARAVAVTRLDELRAGWRGGSQGAAETIALRP
ncbi:hypothetical protein P7K49_020220 [Saguinus oedipus]|uniref:Uncharacterized protein n=1 Tax=Saguinus oedipus TaxID=9490 RepID=A0ABQ9UZQ4_SAGOE|nr:hypothetical protein P7K49_020220 [Saguinus oedipus]